MQLYEEESKLFKALSEPIRIQIIDMLSCKKMCACDILDCLSISQSTLSHHMKILIESELVTGRKETIWMYYTINHQRIEKLNHFIEFVTHEKENCICFSLERKCPRKMSGVKGEQKSKRRLIMTQLNKLQEKS